MPGTRHGDEPFAKGRLQRRQDFCRSGASTSSERRRGLTGHHSKTVAQEEPTGSVRRSIEAVIEGLEGSAPGPHLESSLLDSVAAAIHGVGGAPGGLCSPGAGVIATAAERLQGSSTIDTHRSRTRDAWRSSRRSSRFTHFYVRADRFLDSPRHSLYVGLTTRRR